MTRGDLEEILGEKQTFVVLSQHFIIALFNRSGLGLPRYATIFLHRPARELEL
jgi:hypothetical protein